MYIALSSKLRGNSPANLSRENVETGGWLYRIRQPFVNYVQYHRYPVAVTIPLGSQHDSSISISLRSRANNQESCATTKARSHWLCRAPTCFSHEKKYGKETILYVGQCPYDLMSQSPNSSSKLRSAPRCLNDELHSSQATKISVGYSK